MVEDPSFTHHASRLVVGHPGTVKINFPRADEWGHCMRLSVVAWRTFKPYQIALPFKTFRRQLRERDFTVRVFHSISNKKLFDCDALMILEGDFRKFLPPQSRDRGDEIDLVDRLRARVPRLVWFDESDSSGRMRTYILPHVDVYLKSHLLRDLEGYKRYAITGDPHRDHYINKLGLKDDVHRWKGAPTDKDLDKVRQGWNVGLGDWSLQALRGRRFRLGLRFAPRAYRVNPCDTPLHRRSCDVTYRVGIPSNSETIAFQRREIANLLGQLAQANGIRAAVGGQLDRRAYLAEMRQSVVTPSPFGWGELCYRDFECFIAGSVLMKPDMSHMRTWPDYYEPGTTYFPFSWDLEDFDDVLLRVLSDLPKSEEVASTAQRRFFEAISFEGGERFADFLLGTLGPTR